MESQHEHGGTILIPGTDCPTCHRKVPVASDSPSGPKRDRIVIVVPKGEEGVLDDLLIQLVEKFQEQWPEDARAAREGVGLVSVGERAWKYRALHFSVYACLNVPGLEPTEAGA